MPGQDTTNKIVNATSDAATMEKAIPKMIETAVAGINSIANISATDKNESVVAYLEKPLRKSMSSSQ